MKRVELFNGYSVKHSNLLFAVAPAVCLAIGWGAYEADQQIGEAYEYVRTGGSIHDLSAYSYFEPIATDQQMMWGLELADIIATFSIISFPLFVLAGQMGRALLIRTGERLEQNAPNF